MTEAAAIAVVDNPAAQRFEANVEGHLAFAAYRIAGGSIFFTHTKCRRRSVAAASARP